MVALADPFLDLDVEPDAADEQERSKHHGEELLALGGLDLFDVDAHRSPPNVDTL
jgi:hypothetical protein